MYGNKKWDVVVFDMEYFINIYVAEIYVYTLAENIQEGPSTAKPLI